MRSFALLTTIALATSALAIDHHHQAGSARLHKRQLAEGSRRAQRSAMRRVRRAEAAGALKLAIVVPAEAAAGATTAAVVTTTTTEAATTATTTTTTTSASPTPIKLSTPSYNTTAIWYAETNFTTACNTTVTENDSIVSLPMSFYPGGSVSGFCGQKILVTNPATGVQVILKVGSASWREDYTIMTEKWFVALGGVPIVGELPVSFQFMSDSVAKDAVREVRIYATSSSEAAVASSKAAVAASKSASIADAFSSSAAADAAITSKAEAKSSSLSAAAASATEASVSAENAAAASVSSAKAAEKTTTTTTTTTTEKATTTTTTSTTTTDKPKPTTTTEDYATKSAAIESAKLAVQFTSSSRAAAAAAAETTTTNAAPSPSPKPSSANSNNGNNGGGGGGNGQVHSGGFATYYLQNGVAGNCGTVASDSDKVIALPTAMYAGGSHCGKQIVVTRVSNGATVTATVRDSCPTCDNNECLDLSVSAFTAIATEAEGMVPITWQWA